MSSTQSFTRFNDENYKNWLKTTESLYILRNRIQKFIETETETYHSDLRNNSRLKGYTCSRKCDYKSLCQLCQCWKNEIVANHKMKGNIHWENCQPHLWPKEKWEVAKAYMPGGHKKHCEFAQFDVAAILNFMNHCKHFNIKGQFVTNVINVRNNLMHSPDLKLSKEDTNRHMETVLHFAEMLKTKVPELKDLRQEIKQFNNILDKKFNQAACEVDGQQEDLQTMKDLQKVQDCELQAMKDRIEGIISSLEENQDGEGKETPQDMNNLLDFLEQNKDLLENLEPEVKKLKNLQTKVDKHEEQINNLTDRVGQLEEVKDDPLFPDIPLKHKNHLYEYCRGKKWPENKCPVFTEVQEPQGYKGKVTVNGQSFTGKRVFNDKKAAHQEVARIALEHLKSQEESADEPSSSFTQPEASCSSSSGPSFFGIVTVELNQEVASTKCSSKEEATEAAYRILWERFCINASAEAIGRTFRSQVMEYFNAHSFQNPTEFFDQNDDNTTTCKLKLIGPFTFYDKEGSTTKRQAEQQAAEVALQHLTNVLNFAPPKQNVKNFKGVLKERLDALRLKNPVYDTEDKAQISDEKVTSSFSTDVTDYADSISQSAVTEHSDLKSEDISNSAHLPSSQEPVCAPVLELTDTHDSTSPALKKPKIDCTGNTFYGKVTVDLKKEFKSERCSSKEGATEAAYKILWLCFRLTSPAEGQTYKSLIMEYFKTHDLQKPTEELVDEDNTTTCVLKMNGSFTFYGEEGATRKKQAEQQAAKVALQHLSQVFNFSPPQENEKNFIGALKERLDTLGLSNPVYETEDNKDEISEEPMTSASISQAAVKEHSDLKSDISTSAQLPSSQESVCVPAFVQPDTQDSSSPALKKHRIESTGNTFFGKVTVDLKQELKSDRCSSKEEATEAAYQILWQSFRISAPAKGQTYRSIIMEYFKTHDLQTPTEEIIFHDDNTTICILGFNGPFTFFDKDGATKKKQAEQQAAKVALQHLSRILNFSPPLKNEKNFIGVLKERLETLRLSNPVYETEDGKDEISEEPMTSDMSPNFSKLSISQAAVKELSKSEDISTSPHLPSSQESVNIPVPVKPQDSTSLASLSKRPRIDSPEINKLLNVYNLVPPRVKVENMKYDANFKCTVEINLEKYTWANKEGYDSKKEATRKTYMLFGLAVMILAPDTDEKKSSGDVKQYFVKKSLAPPEEDVLGSQKPFYCSLKNINYNVKYEGQGSSEDEAKLHALQKALRSLSTLFNYPSLAGAECPVEVLNQLISMLKGSGQKEPVVSLHSLTQASVQLSFCDYTLKCTSQSNKKAARNHLCTRILGLLGVETGANDAPSRNRLNEWFVQQKRTQPVFEDTEEATGAKATFSVEFTCASPDSEDRETAEKMLLEELKHRFQFLDDKKN